MIDTEELQEDVDTAICHGNDMYLGEFYFKKAVLMLLLAIVQRLDAIKEGNHEQASGGAGMA